MIPHALRPRQRVAISGPRRDAGIELARGHPLFDLSARYRYRNLEAFLSVENVANVEWREAQFFFDSRLPGEPAGGVPDIHYTPGNPRTFLGGLALRF